MQNIAPSFTQLFLSIAELHDDLIIPEDVQMSKADQENG